MRKKVSGGKEKVALFDGMVLFLLDDTVSIAEKDCVLRPFSGWLVAQAEAAGSSHQKALDQVLVDLFRACLQLGGDPHVFGETMRKVCEHGTSEQQETVSPTEELPRASNG